MARTKFQRMRPGRRDGSSISLESTISITSRLSISQLPGVAEMVSVGRLSSLESLILTEEQPATPTSQI